MGSMKKRQTLFLLGLMFVIATILFACGRENDKGPDTKTVVDIAGIADGTHRGTFTYGGFNYVVDVTARGGQIEGITVIQNKVNEQSILAEAILEVIIATQSLDVDAVSGATVSSKALLKAVENAIKSAK